MDQPLLRVDMISKRFGGLQAVKEVSFTIEGGGIVGLIGPNGAGKSTFFDLISGVQPYDSGRALFKGVDLTGKRPHQIAALGMSRTFQKVRLFPKMTVIHNVMVGAYLRTAQPEVARAKGEEALKRVGLYDQRNLPVSSLNLVDRKRLEMARALSTGPSLLLLDEVMCGLNPAEIAKIVDLMRHLGESGVTIMVVEHLLNVIFGLCRQVLVLDHGELIANGTPDQVRQDLRVIEAYIGRAVENRA